MGVFTGALAAIHGVLAVDAEVSILTDTLRVIDKTSGIELQLDKNKMPSILPAAAVTAAALADAGVTVDDLIGAVITMNGKDWKVVNRHVRPTPEGESEFLLILREE